MGVFFALLAGMVMPLTNLSVRKGVDAGGTSKGYFVFQMLSSFTFALLLGPIMKRDFSITLPDAVLGVSAGLILSVMLFSVGKAVEKGPAGFSFAILNSATVVPGILMALVFGVEYGYIYNFWHALGSLLVLFGLFWAAKGLKGMNDWKMWIFFSIVMFVFHTLLLALYQWRALLLSFQPGEELFPFFEVSKMQSSCFTPFMFFTSGLIQFAIFLYAEKRPFKPQEMLFGSLGGLSNLICTLLLLSAASYATNLENAIIYPIFSVVGIILTNAWGQKLYQEEVNWRACQLCVFGLIVGTVDWKTVAAAIGF